MMTQTNGFKDHQFLTKDDTQYEDLDQQQQPAVIRKMNQTAGQAHRRNISQPAGASRRYKETIYANQHTLGIDTHVYLIEITVAPNR